MRIRSDFDSGNIDLLDSSNDERILLAIKPDTHSHHFQWFHFVVQGLSPAKRYGFVITNAGQAAYAHAWQDYHAVASYDGENWFRVPSEYENGELRFALTPEHDSVRFAYFEPYSRERHQTLLSKAVAAGGEVVARGRSIQGRDLELLQFGQNPARKVWIIAQQHPGEHMAQWFMEGLIERLAERTDPQVAALLSGAQLYLVVNMNPDGAYAGHLRTNYAGQDLNRAWQSASEERSPEVKFVLEQMHARGVDMFLDIHGDEEIPYVFSAGCEGNPGYTPRLAELEQAFRTALEAQGEFQSVHGYARDEPGQANLALACNAVGEAFDCLSFTLEMPFKDHNDNPQPATGWNGARSKQLGADMLSVIASLLPRLREA